MTNGYASVAALAVLLCGAAQAAYEPKSAYVETAAVAARYPDPAASYTTPAFATGKQDFTSQSELMAFLEDLSRSATTMHLDASARSQQDRVLPVLFFSLDRGAIGNGQKPVILIIGQQHGNEPAGGEASLVLAQRLGKGDLAGVLDKVDVIIVPRANPDGAEAFARSLSNGIDANRDHTLLRTPEIRTIGALFTRYNPQVVLDCHEFTVGGRWIEKVGGLVRIDAMLQYATVPNLPPSLQRAEADLFLPAIRAAFDAKRLTHDWYHTTDGSRPNSPVAMGGIGPDTGRNVAGLRNAISFLLETRGVGIGRAHLARRVETHLVAAEAIIRLAAADPAKVMALSRQAAIEASTATDAVIVIGRQRPEKRELIFIDPASGADKPATVNWLSALDPEALLTRQRPAGYLVTRTSTQAIEALNRAGLTTRTLAQAGSVPGEVYRASALAAGAKEDGRGDDTGAGAILKGTYATERGDIAVAAGDVFVPLDQPLAGLAVALLEPENDSGLVANRLLPVAEGQVLPVARLDRAP